MLPLWLLLLTENVIIVAAVANVNTCTANVIIVAAVANDVNVTGADC